MSVQLWGEFTDADSKPNEKEKIVPTAAKRVKLEEMQSRAPNACDKNVMVKVKNPLVTQTIEVMKQTEMLQSLIDTYSNKSGTSNYLLNPLQMIPEVDFPPENAADFVSDDKFVKPIWFIPPLATRFARGLPQTYPELNTEVCRASLRKAVCGQLRVTGFTDTAESALVLFSDAIEEFVRNLMQQIREVHANDPQLEMQNEVEVKSLEKAYFSFTNTSLTQVHNYFKHNLVARNRLEIAEFNGVLQEYDKLMKESQSMLQKEEFQEGDFLNILEMPHTSDTMGGMVIGAGGTSAMHHDISTGGAGTAIISMLDSGGQAHMSVPQPGGSFKEIFEPKTHTDNANPQEQNATDCVTPYSNPPTDALL